MSRLGKQPIAIPEDIEVKLEDGVVSVKGPLGELSRSMRSDISITVENGLITLTPANDTHLAKALWGTYASLINSMLQGVRKPFEKKLIVEGVGYRATHSGDLLTLSVGFSHPVELQVPENITISVEKNVISISGLDKEAVGQFAAKIRAVKKPEPYKGKGIRYDDEVVRRKQGKRAVT